MEKSEFPTHMTVTQALQWSFLKLYSQVDLGKTEEKAEKSKEVCECTMMLLGKQENPTQPNSIESYGRKHVRTKAESCTQ